MPFYDAIRLARRLMARRHDVYHLNPSLVPRAVIRDGLFNLVLRLFRRNQVLVFFRGWDEQFYNRIARSSAYRTIFRFTYGGASRILVLANKFADDLAALGFQPGRIYTLTTMFDGDLFKNVTRERTDNTVYVVFLGRFVASKGIYELLEGFRQASIRSENISLIMAGDGPEAQRARDWCTRHNVLHRVTFTGHVEDSDKAQLLVNADIFALPSYREGCPNALIEAMGAGLPVIVTSVGGIPDIVQNSLNGLIVNARDSKAIAQGIMTLVDDVSLRREMGDRNRIESWEKYESTSVTQLLQSHYSAVATKRSRITDACK